MLRKIGPRWLILLGIALLPVESAEAQQPNPSVILQDLRGTRVQPEPDPGPKVIGATSGDGERFVPQRVSTFYYVLDQAAANASGLGASLEQADRAVRAQLGLPNDRGLVVSSVADDGPAARAGLLENDILLTLDDKPLDRPDDLVARLKEAGEKAAPLALIRAGKPLTIRIKPEYRVSFTAVQPEKTEYYIGVPVKAVDATLRAHLPDLPEGQGLVVDGVETDSPAARAGLKLSDILLTIGDAPVSSVETLVAHVQATGGKPVPLQILRGGKPLTLQITPAPRKEATATQVMHDEKTLLRWNVVYFPSGGLYESEKPNGGWIGDINYTNQFRPVPTAAPDGIEKRLDALDRELKQLRETIEALRKALKPEGEPKK
jgi:serine protease Do